LDEFKKRLQVLGMEQAIKEIKELESRISKIVNDDDHGRKKKKKKKKPSMNSGKEMPEKDPTGKRKLVEVGITTDPEDAD
jgi:hypothetical protein